MNIKIPACLTWREPNYRFEFYLPEIVIFTNKSGYKEVCVRLDSAFRWKCCQASLVVGFVLFGFGIGFEKYKNLLLTKT